MIDLNALRREFGFMRRDRAMTVTLWMVVVLSTLSIISGLLEIREQRQTIESLVAADQQERLMVLHEQDDWGMAAYYSFHLTYDTPSDFAFAAIGQRETAPWKHRVRMLALEGQIYERDAGHPVLALTGRFDFAFFAAFLLPLVLIVALHDLRSSERDAGRHDLLVATAATGRSLWRARFVVRGVAVFVATSLPLIVGSWVSATAPATVLAALLVLAAYLLFWLTLIFFVAARRASSGSILTSLVGVWVLLAVAVPAVSRVVIDHWIHVPTGTDILMTQREAVNDAWDLPKEATMEPFIEEHPEWADFTQLEQSFEWKWYYAFQQVGDQRARSLANAYRDGRARRDQLADWASVLSPPAAFERWLQRLAGTDVSATLDYESSVRTFHRRLRQYYYPKLFQGQPYTKEALTDLPTYAPEG